MVGHSFGMLGTGHAVQRQSRCLPVQACEFSAGQILGLRLRMRAPSAWCC